MNKDTNSCSICNGKGYYTYGGSFGGPRIVEKCKCVKLIGVCMKQAQDMFMEHEEEVSWGRSIYIIGRTGEAIGRVYMYNDDKAQGYISNLHVSVGHRGKGIGTGLLKKCEGVCMSMGCTGVYLRIHRVNGNTNWYRKMGYNAFEIDKDENSYIWFKKEFTGVLDKDTSDTELQTMIANVHEALEGRYELTGYDLHMIHGYLCEYNSKQ